MTRPYPTMILFAALLYGCCACSSTRPVAQTGSARPIAFSGAELVAEGETLSSSYRLRVDDLIEIQYHVEPSTNHTFRFETGQSVEVKFIDNPDLNELQTVRNDGQISLPYLGDVPVMGRTVEELTAELKRRYAPILPSSELYVVVREEPLPADLQVANEPGRDFLVRPDGYIGFPRIGDVRVADRTLNEVTQDLKMRYARVQPGLLCTLRLRAHAESLVYVMGHVNKPGAYRIDRSTNVLKALSLAGGNQPGADLANVVVMRVVDGNMKMQVMDLEKTVKVASGARYMNLQPDDMIYVATGSLAETAEFTRTLSDILFFRGWGFTFSYRWNEIIGTD